MKNLDLLAYKENFDIFFKILVKIKIRIFSERNFIYNLNKIHIQIIIFSKKKDR